MFPYPFLGARIILKEKNKTHVLTRVQLHVLPPSPIDPITIHSKNEFKSLLYCWPRQCRGPGITLKIQRSNTDLIVHMAQADGIVRGAAAAHF